MPLHTLARFGRWQAIAAAPRPSAATPYTDGVWHEPPAWHAPARHTLGALLLEAGRVAAAERVDREDLKIHPANGWALAGLAQSLARQGRSTAAVRSDFARAWANADFVLNGSQF